MTITVDDLTKNELEGTGVFDELMRSVKAHLTEQLNTNRITPVNYSSVYLSALQSTMSLSVKFLLEKNRAEKEGDLIQAQIDNLGKEGAILDLKEKELKIEIENAKYQSCLLQRQIDKVEAENQSTLQSTANAVTQASLISKQITKTEAEILLYKQKKLTESAQIGDKVNGAPVAGVVGIQKEMYRNQANGYLRLSEQQNARLMLDAYAVIQTNVGLDNLDKDLYGIDNWGVTPAVVKDAVTKLQAGVVQQDLEHEGKINPQDDSAYDHTVSSDYVEDTPQPVSPPTSCIIKTPLT